MLVYNNREEFYAYMNRGVKIEKRSRLHGLTEICAFMNSDTLTFAVRVPRVCCASSAVMKLYRDEDISNRRLRAELADFGCEADIFEVSLESGEICIDRKSGGLFYYTFELETPWGSLCVNCNASSKNYGTLTDINCAEYGQLSVYNGTGDTLGNFKGGMMYQIFPDRFARSKDEIESCETTIGEVAYGEGKYLNRDWENGIPEFAEIPGGELANNTFFGGSLWGIAEQLDYIKSLGASIIYLCPIFEAASNHRYDIGDYMKIDSLLGGEEAFANLAAELKKRGMKLILDGVFNHTGADSRYFNKFGKYKGQGAYNSKRSCYYKWYTFREYPDEYNCWWGVKILPEVKSGEASFREFICGENGIARRYLRLGADGWRLDVADELSDDFLDDFRAAVKAENPSALILGEVWEDASNKIAYDKRRRYFNGKQLDSVMNYPLRDAVIAYILTADSSKLYETAAIIYTHYPKEVCDVLMNFLGTHDTERILTVLAGVGPDRMTNAELSVYKLPKERRVTAVKRLKLAWALLAAFPGIPCIYYGDETGMEGGRDPFNRMPFRYCDESLTEYYRKIGEIHTNEPVFTDGKLEMIETGETSQVLFRRIKGDETVIVAVNLSAREWEIEFTTEPQRLFGGVSGKFIRIQPETIEYFKM